MVILSFFFVYFDSQTKICFEEIKTSSKFGVGNSGFVKTRFVKPSVEQITRFLPRFLICIDEFLEIIWPHCVRLILVAEQVVKGVEIVTFCSIPKCFRYLVFRRICGRKLEHFPHYVLERIIEKQHEEELAGHRDDYIEHAVQETSSAHQSSRFTLTFSLFSM